MAAIISGIVFQDTNRNSVYDTGDSGIPGVYVVVRYPDNSCVNLISNPDGFYNTDNLTVVGTYTVYETVVAPNGCPPTNFAQPTGYNESTTQRVSSIDVSQSNIDSNTNIIQNFGHVNNIPFGCTSDGIQISGSTTSISTINLVTGAEVNKGNLSPAATYNAIGYSTVDGFIYGYSQTARRVISISRYTTVNILADVPNLLSTLYNAGSVNNQGYLFLYNGSATPLDRYYVVDVNPNSATYLKLVNPATNQEQTTAPFGIGINPSISIGDWSFNPINNNLYAVSTSSSSVIQIIPTNGSNQSFSTSGLPSGNYGALFFDNLGNLYAINNISGKLYKITINTGAGTATAIEFSQAVGNLTNNDGARCPLATINILTAIKSVDAVTALTGQILTYTIILTNLSKFDATNVVIIDLIPAGTSFVDGSVTVNSSPTGDNPSLGIAIGTIVAETGSVTVTFKVTIGNNIPTVNPIPNTANIAYTQGDNLWTNTVYTMVYSSNRGVEFI